MHRVYVIFHIRQNATIKVNKHSNTSIININNKIINS